MNAERSKDTASESSSRPERSSERPAEKTAAAEPSRREERSSPIMARDSRSGTETGRAELVAQLNEVTRELATLRATNAKLRAEREAPSSSSSTFRARAEPADDKLNSTLRSYTQFKQELSGIVADMEKLRADNASLNTQVKELKAKSDNNAAASVARLERELQAERAARAEAERTATSLRDQLRAVARAVNAAGVAPESGSRSGGR